jgi:polar amino acid transport system substrate-binding protein
VFWVRAVLIAVLGSGSLFALHVQAASLAVIRERGGLHVCAHPDALPFSSQDRLQPGFQLEIAEAVAKQLGVRLHVDWIVFADLARRTDCDALMGVVVPRDQRGDKERGLRLTKPYAGGGYVLIVPRAAPNVRRIEDLHGTIGVQHTSWPHYLLDTRGIPTLSYASQLAVIEAVVQGKVVGGLVANAYAGWYLKQHPGGTVQIADAYVPSPELQWDMAVGLRNADDALLKAMNQALDRLLTSRTIPQIFARYGVTYIPPSKWR